MVVINVCPKLGPRVNKEFLRSLEKERVLFDSKEVRLTVRVKAFKGKGIYVSSSVSLSRGRLIITRERFIAIAGGHKIVDVPKGHELFDKLGIDKSEPNRYTISLDLGELPIPFVGTVSLAYHIDPRLVEDRQWLRESKGRVSY